MLRRTHGHHRDVRALASAPRATSLRLTNRETFTVTRHGLTQFPSATPSLRPTIECASSLVSNAAKLSRAGNAHRHSHLIPRQFKPIGSRPAAPSAGRDAATLS